jgi:hypothetical protein
MAPRVPGSRAAERHSNALPPDNRPGGAVYAALDMPFAFRGLLRWRTS